ncbi:hypothetical protein K504DRAFT_216370 [Pleomassaria siparia CBS 279.74]|uniref:Uncharacterized protein n=1 Tax=Pleomassaria siparia CBS 279.74 TaxID=1314801 RepID=A0A6G1KFV5_9PLEO|nr:hypothetical protein K504DRAFT_216370 [Pleomassaria siparia CBS 279.74]
MCRVLWGRRTGAGSAGAPIRLFFGWGVVVVKVEFLIVASVGERAPFSEQWQWARAPRRSPCKACSVEESVFCRRRVSKEGWTRWRWRWRWRWRPRWLVVEVVSVCVVLLVAEDDSLSWRVTCDAGMRARGVNNNNKDKDKDKSGGDGDGDDEDEDEDEDDDNDDDNDDDDDYDGRGEGRNSDCKSWRGKQSRYGGREDGDPLRVAEV